MDFAYYKLSQTEDVCTGCIYNVDDKCTFEGDPNTVALPAGCPKKPETQKIFRLTRKLVESQAFAPGPGPWEGDASSPITEEVSRSSPERSGFGPFGKTFQTHAHTGYGIFLSSIVRNAHMLGLRKARYIATIKRAQIEGAFNLKDLYDDIERMKRRIIYLGNIYKDKDRNIYNRLHMAYEELLNMEEDLKAPFKAAKDSRMEKISFRLCYFCGQPVFSGGNYSIVFDFGGKKSLGVAHLECAQTAAEQYQGEFDDQGDFILSTPQKKEYNPDEEIDVLDEVVLLKDFENYPAGELGRVVREEEAEEEGLSPIRVDGKIYVKFDKDDSIHAVPSDILAKTSSMEKVAILADCPKGYVQGVLLVMDHCYLASDDPNDVFACHDKTCKYHRPVSKMEWDRLMELEHSSPVGIVRRLF